jgi:hypothetical protein
MADSAPSPLTRAEIASLQAAAARGKIPTLEQVRRYVASTRVSYLAAETRSKPKDRTAKPSPNDDKQIDFF